MCRMRLELLLAHGKSAGGLQGLSSGSAYVGAWPASRLKLLEFRAVDRSEQRLNARYLRPFT
jgi:hypothetical protein